MMGGLKMRAVHTCPLWEDPDGRRRPGLAEEPDHPPVVGWVNVMDVDVAGERHLLLLTNEAAS